MKRAVTLMLAAGVVVAAVVLAGPELLDRDRDGSHPATDSDWYHASDVAQLASTGRPQLVEFFHPD